MYDDLQFMYRAYNLPQRLWERTKIIRSARVYAMAQSWLTFSGLEEGLEPEVNEGGDNNQRQGEPFFTPAQAKSFTPNRSQS